MITSATSRPHCSVNQLFYLVITGMILFILTGTSTAQPQTVDPILGQSVFSTPELAAQTLVKAISDRDKEALDKILGADHRSLLAVDEIDPADRENFLTAWEKSHTLVAEAEGQRLIAVGENKWTLPIPIAQSESGWYFDVEAGVELVRIRRIGRNELAAMQAVLAYYDAQMEYAEEDRDNNGRLEYAQQFVSSAGKHDGLYWDVAAGEKLSPLGPLFAETQRGDVYYGYRYKILKSQGENAQGGAYNYLINGRMLAGFALVAWPAEYGDSGVMSFIVSHNGIIFEQDLGPESAKLANDMQEFDPAPDWNPVQEAHVQEVSNTIDN